jgi:2'-5' RNA ligase
MPFRAFISVDLERFSSLRSLVQDVSAASSALKVVNTDQMHLTLKFLGDTAENLVPSIVSIMKDSVQGVEPFKIRLVGTGAFPNLDYMRVLWVGLDDGGILGPIARNLDVSLSKFGFEREEREFSPHVTIARVKGSQGKEKLKAILNEHKTEVFGEQQVSGIRLKKSVLMPQGPDYSTVEEVRI